MADTASTRNGFYPRMCHAGCRNNTTLILIRMISLLTPPSRSQREHGHVRTSALVGVVLDEERLLDRRLRAGRVLALGGLRVGLRAREQLHLRILVLVVLAAPNLDARRLRAKRAGGGGAWKGGAGSIATWLGKLELRPCAMLLTKVAVRGSGTVARAGGAGGAGGAGSAGSACLQGARVGEGEREGTLAVELVDLVQVDGRVLLRDAAW